MAVMRAPSFPVVLVSAALLFGCAGEPGLDERTFTGMPLEQVRATLGEPDRVEEIHKTDSHIFGPIEGLWDRAETGDAIVTWVYETPLGRKELSFVEGEKEVGVEFFWYHDQSKNPVF